MAFGVMFTETFISMHCISHIYIIYSMEIHPINLSNGQLM